MIFRFLADAVLVLHLAFIAFVVLGGFVVLRFHALAWIHLPAVAWAVATSLLLVCPLTPLENRCGRSAATPAMGADSSSTTDPRGFIRRA